MKLKLHLLYILLPVILVVLSAAPVPAADIVLDTMREEMTRSMTLLGEKGTPPPYFMYYQITDSSSASVRASFGALRESGMGKLRLLDVDVRVGSPQLDNTHHIRGNRQGEDNGSTASSTIAVEDDPDAVKAAIWLETDKNYKEAVEMLIQIKANKSVTVSEEDQSDDFSIETPNRYIGPLEVITPDLPKWEKKIKRYSAMFSKYPQIYNVDVSLSASAVNTYFVNSEGASLRHGRVHWRISINAGVLAEDGMRLYKYESFDARTEANLPDDKTIETTINQLIKDLLDLRNAPLMDPYTGPAILSGKASAVFFHEIFGHRIEGHRQKDEKEGQTFTSRVNKEVLPLFISVFDDPTMNAYGDIDLNGHYRYDEEGVQAQRVDLVQDGVLKNFLMSRSPIKGFSKSNGHGRSQAGRRPVSRQGTLVVEPSQKVSDKELRQQLIELCKKQNKPYGLFFEDISGGFTFTNRYMPQSFNVTPIMVYRIYTDGRPDQLVRGVDLIGTPLTSFSKIVACGDTPGIFNGYCGAESGSIPASAISPAILTTQIEVQKKRKASNKPPLLTPPQKRGN